MLGSVEMLGNTKNIKVHAVRSERPLENQCAGSALSWRVADGVIELALHREPCNELGSASLDELETFATALEEMQAEAHALIIYSELKPGFCAGADLRELYERSQTMDKSEAVKGVREFLQRIHRVLNLIDAAPLTTIAAVHGVTFRWRIRAGAGLRFDYRRQDGAVLFSGAEAGIDSGVWRDSAPEAGFGQCRGERSVADRTEL